MKRTIAALSTVAALVAVLAACAGLGTAQPSIDPASVDVVLTTNPEQAIAGDSVELHAILAGVGETEEIDVSFEIRLDRKPSLVDAAYGADGAFTAAFTFPQQGSYDVYIHMYIGDLHITKKKQVHVQ